MDQPKKEKSKVSLSEEQKSQLDGNIKNMIESGASQQDVEAYAKDFRESISLKKKDVPQQDTPFLSENSELESSQQKKDGSLGSSRKDDRPKIEPVKGGLAEQVERGDFDEDLNKFKEEQIADKQEIETLLSSYNDFTKISEADISEADAIIKEEEEGDFGFFGNIKNAVLSTPSFGTFANPFFNPAKTGNIPEKVQLRKDLAKERGIDMNDISPEELQIEFKKKRKLDLLKNKKALKTEEFIESISDEEKNNLTKEFRYNWAKLNVESQKILIETEGLGKDLELATNQLDSILKSHDSEKDYPEEYYTNNIDLGQQVRDMLSEYEKKITELNKKDDDLASVSEEIDLFKRNYDKLTNFYKKSIGSIGKLGVNGVYFLNEGSKAIKDATGVTLPMDEVAYQQIRSINEKVRSNIEKEEDGLARPQKLDDIQGLGDIEGITEWAMNVVAEQTGNTAVLIASGGSSALGNVSLGILATSSAGAKLNELDKEIASGKDYSNVEKWTVAVLAGTLEGVTEKISLGQINKGLRVFKSAPFNEIKKTTADYIRRNALNDIKAYSKDVSEEVLGETINDLAGKFSEQIFLGKEVNYLEGLDETILSSAFMSGIVYKTPQIGNQVRKSFSSKDDNQKIAENSRAILEITEQLNGNMSDTSRKKLEEKKIQLAENSLDIIDSSISNLDNIELEDKKALIEINNDFFELRKEYFDIQSDLNLKKEYKEGLLQELEAKGEALDARKKEIISVEVKEDSLEDKKNTSPKKEDNSVSNDTKDFASKLSDKESDIEDISQYVGGNLKITVGDTDLNIKSLENGNIKIESVSTKKSQRNKGNARKAITKATEVADEQGKTLELNVVPLDESTSTEGLIKLYEDAGFVKDDSFNEEDGGRMFREPNNEDAFSGIDNVISEIKNDNNKPVEKTSTSVETNLNDYSVEVVEGELSVSPKFGNAKPSPSEVKKITEEYISKTNFDDGTATDLRGMDSATPYERGLRIAEESTNALEVANAIIEVTETVEDINEVSQDTVPDAIAEVLRSTNVDDTNIEVIMAAAEASKKTRDSINQKLRDKKNLTNDVKKELVKYINESINSKRLNEIQKRELSKLLTLVKNAKTKKQFVKALAQVNEIVIGLDNKIALRSIDKILGSKFSKKESGRRKANITDEQAEKSLKSIKEYTATPKPKGSDASVSERRNERISELLDRRDVIDAKENPTENELLDYESLSIAINILSALESKNLAFSNQLLVASLERIDAIYNEGRSRLKEAKEQRKEEDEKRLSELREDINPDGKESGLSVKELQSQNKGILNRIKRVMFEFNHGSITGSLDSLSTLISRKGGDNRDSSPLVQFVNKLKRRETLKKTRVGLFSKQIKNAQEQIFGGVRKADGVLGKKVTLTLQRPIDNEEGADRTPVQVPLTVSKMLNVWMNYRNPRLIGGLDANGFTDEVVAEIERILPESAKEYGEFLFGVYDQMYEDSNEVYQQMNFHSLGKEPFYAGKVFRSDTSLKEDTNTLLGGVTSINTTGYGSQKERVINDKPIEAIDVNYLVKKAIQESSHYVAYAEVHRQYNQILKDKEIQKGIQLNNKGTGDLIMSALNYYKTRDLEQGGDRGFPIVDFFGRNIAKATLALKPKIGVTQMISIINGSFDMPTGLNPVDFVSYYNPATVLSTMKFLLNNSDYLKSRYDVGGIDQAMLGLSDLASQSEISFNNSEIESKRKSVARFYKKLQDIAMINVKLGDAVGVMGAVPAYNAWLDKYKKQGMSDAMAQEKAMDKFEASVDRSQQTTSTFGKSKFQKDPLLRYFAMFATSPIQNQQNAFFHFRELKRGLLKGSDSAKGKNIRNALAFMNYQFAQPMLYTYIASYMSGSLFAALGFGDEEPDDVDKDLLRAAIMGNYNSVPIIGGISQLLIETAIGKENSFGGLLNSALLDNTTKLQESWLKAFTAPSEKIRQKNTKKALKLTSGLLSGMPNFIFDNIDAIDTIYWNDEVDNEVKFLKGLGYSDFVIEQARTARISRAKSEKKKEQIRKKYERSLKKYQKEVNKTNPIFKPLKESKKRN